MIYIIDTANLEQIKHVNEFYPIDGVTTNPSIISKEKGDFKKLLLDIRNVIGPDKMLHVQTTQKEASKIVEEAKALRELLGENFYVKIPVNEEGLKATMELKKLGIGVTMTAIFTQQQALMSAKAGADFVAPYVNRLDNVVADGANVVKEIVELFRIYNLPCKVLAASFKNAEQVHKVALAGAQSITINADLYKALIFHPLTDKAIADFDKDWKGVYGDKCPIDLI